MIDNETLERKRAEAAAYVGVTYDRRIDRFTAAITVRGEKRYLGSFLTAGEASIVYEQARENDPIERPRRGAAKSLRHMMIAFEETAQRGEDKKLLPGQVFTTPDGQRFRLEGVSREGKSSRYVWSSPCKVCGVLFEHNSTMFVRSVTGMTRTCETHRGKLGQLETHDWPDPVEWENAPRVFGAENKSRAAKHTSKNKNEIAESLDGLRSGPLKDYGLLLRKTRPNISLSEVIERYEALKKDEAAYKSSARQEDIEMLAADPPPDNSDLLG